MDKAGTRRLLFAAYTSLLILVTCKAREEKNHLCAPSSCGSIHNISFPFRLNGDPPNCGDPRYNLSCESNLTVLYLYSGKFYVQAINYSNYTIRIVDAGLHNNNCSSIPRYSLTPSNFSHYSDPYTCYKYRWSKSEYFPEISNASAAFVTCENPVNSPHYIIYSSNTSLNHLKRYSYVMLADTYARVSELEDLCRVEVMFPSPGKEKNISYLNIRNDLLYGFQLSWFRVHCNRCTTKEFCHLDDTDNVQLCTVPINLSDKRFVYIETALLHNPLLVIINKIVNKLLSPNSLSLRGRIRSRSYFFGVIIATSSRLLVAIIGCILIKLVFGGPCVAAFLIYKWRRRHISMHDNVEEFLQTHNNLMPIRYSYANIKNMTSNFKVKLGEGGYGSVYKGKLRTGHLVAVKLLGKSKDNGQDFINEVASIGRIHHTNVVQLVGFCAEGTKRALVYDFMPSGSLDKYIILKEGSISIPFTWEKMYRISLGVAHGIEYLHRGCEMKILHFDIKPHNILLDENFTPKISDFGLAKLYSVDDSIVSLTMARGTIGYIAPELFYKNIGGISYKADVYSYGMLLMEITGRKKKLNAFANSSSQIYFPSWVHDQIVDGNDIEIGDDATEEEKRIVKKLIIVALWCIQMQPSSRPSMNEVIEMLKGDLECLQIPPKPFLYPQHIPAEKDETNTSSTYSSTQGDDSTDCIKLEMPVAVAEMDLSSVSADS